MATKHENEQLNKGNAENKDVNNAEIDPNISRTSYEEMAEENEETRTKKTRQSKQSHQAR